MSSKLNICNLALSHLAMKPILQAELDAVLTPSSKAFTSYYRFARDDVFREWKWPFSTVQKLLDLYSDDVTTPIVPQPWSFAYYYPTNYDIDDLDIWNNGIDVDSRTAWSSLTAYVVGDLVKYNNIAYISIQNGTNKQPDTQTAYWTAQTAAYEEDDVVVYNNVAYKAIQDGTNKNPATEDDYWTPQTNVATVWSVFNAATSDKKDEQDFQVYLIPGATDQRIICSNLEEAYMEYTFIVNDTTLWDAKFVMALSYRLAAMMCHLLIGDAAKGEKLMNVSISYISETKRTSAIEKLKKPKQSSSYKTAR